MAKSFTMEQKLQKACDYLNDLITKDAVQRLDGSGWGENPA